MSCLHDVFISYSHEDTDWVDNELVPSLHEAGLTVFIDSDQFLAGEILRHCIERGVRSSRHTLIVLTPDWLASEWARYEELLASAGDPLRRQRKVIPLLLRDCRPDGGLALLLYVDFTTPPRRKAQMEWLLRSLREDGLSPLPAAMPMPPISPILPTPPAEPPPVPGEPVGHGLEALGKLMQTQRVREAVIAFRIHFEEACRQIEILGNYKDQHDLLHRLQNECYDHIILEVQRFPDDEHARTCVEDGELVLGDVLRELRNVAAGDLHDATDTAWIETDLVAAHTFLCTALERSDAESLRRSVGRLNTLLTFRPSQINTLLNSSAKALRLPHLVQSLRSLCEGLSGQGLDSEHVRQFESGVTALAELNQSLACLVWTHHLWQEVDLDLRRIQTNLLAQNPKELEYSWADVSSKLEALCADLSEAWALDLDADQKHLTSALEEGSPGKVSSHFRNCRRRANFRFFQVDCALKKQCDELRKIGEPLASVLRMIKK